MTAVDDNREVQITTGERVTASIPIVEPYGSWAAQYPGIAKENGLVAQVWQDGDSLSRLRIAMPARASESEVFRALDMALILVDTAKDRAGSADADPTAVERHVKNWLSRKATPNSAQ
jgi:hypothetical protein